MAYSCFGINLSILTFSLWISSSIILSQSLSPGAAYSPDVNDKQEPYATRELVETENEPRKLSTATVFGSGIVASETSYTEEPSSPIADAVAPDTKPSTVYDVGWAYEQLSPGMRRLRSTGLGRCISGAAPLALQTQSGKLPPLASLAWRAQLSELALLSPVALSALQFVLAQSARQSPLALLAALAQHPELAQLAYQAELAQLALLAVLAQLSGLALLAQQLPLARLAKLT
ncbi:hypothetical protein CYMTET_56774 [Cymbomonas tetramitiformis]|uniref:Uncharacterized protein n=1 Tax=Cymbomonas tetramitiformis TaxID=36881 RepID=A0AAE0ELY7_9CHLO|nr:hypothetical protein CYMTET_56774 [Cymbomonas tetramitiformis]